MKSDFGIIMQNTVNSFPFFFSVSDTLCLFDWPRIKKGHMLESDTNSLFYTKSYVQFWQIICNSWIKFLANSHLQLFFYGGKHFFILVKIKQQIGG